MFQPPCQPTLHKVLFPIPSLVLAAVLWDPCWLPTSVTCDPSSQEVPGSCWWLAEGLAVAPAGLGSRDPPAVCLTVSLTLHLTECLPLFESMSLSFFMFS